MNRINTCEFTDAEAFLRRLNELAEAELGLMVFRGQSKDWSLEPSACRDSHPLARKWIRAFVDLNMSQLTRFSDFRWDSESDIAFQRRYELALRNYIESEIIYKFQEFATDSGLIELSRVECVHAPNPRMIAEYLGQDGIPLFGKIWYAPLLAQHHEVPTRLLDWTSNVDVAIDFALDGVTDSEGRIVIWAITPWNSRVHSVDSDCDEQLLTSTFSQTGFDSARMLMEKPLHGTCLKLYTPPNKYQNYVYIMQHAHTSEDGVEHRGRQFRVKVDKVHEVYVNDQEGNASVDMWHDRYFYEHGSGQPLESRLADSAIPRNKVYKFTLPYSETHKLSAQLGDFEVKRLYDHDLYAQFDNYRQPSNLPIDQIRLIRRQNFLSALETRINFDIDWDAFDL